MNKKIKNKIKTSLEGLEERIEHRSVVRYKNSQDNKKWRARPSDIRQENSKEFKKTTRSSLKIPPPSTF